jgi:hypothetical protein
MNKFYNYVAPIAFAIFYFAFVPAVFSNLGSYGSVAFALIGLGVPLIWLNRIANLYQNKSIVIASTLAFSLLILWIIWAILYINAW